MRDNKGFTLIELLIVVVIIGILAAIAIPKFSATREKAYYAAMKSDLRNLATQEEIYYSDNYSYTNDTAALEFAHSQAVTVAFSNVTSTGWAATATHLSLPNQGCAYYYGSAAAPTVPGGAAVTEAGTVTCTN